MSSSKSKKSSAKSRRPTFSIVVLVAFIVAVFAFIGHRQVRSAEERRLRLLAGFADRIETTVPDLADRFRRITARRCAEQVDDYLDLVPHLEHLSVQTFWKPCSDGDERPRVRESVDVHTADGDVTARFCRAGDCDFTRGASDGVLEGQWVKAAEARIQLDEVLEPMIIPGIFDLVVIADRSGTVLHQQGEAALKVAHLDALLGHDREEGAQGDQESWTRRIAQEGSDAGRLLLRAVQGEGAGTLAGAAGDPGAATAIVKTKIADADYSVFLQPVILAIEPEEGQPSPAPERWVAVGVISSERLLSAGVVTSPILLFLLVSILPLGLISWPFLKLALISRRQRFTRLDCAFLVLATVLALSFGALLLVDGLFMTRLHSTIDGQLEDLSEVISRNFRMELLDARLQLGALTHSIGVGEDGAIRDAPDYFEYKDWKATGDDEGPFVESFIRFEVANFLENRKPRIYPYFDSVFWPDPQGDVERATVPLRGHAVLPQNVADRDYVRCAQAWNHPITLKLSSEFLDQYRRTRCGDAGDRATSDRACTPPGLLSWERPLQLCLSAILDRTTGAAAAAVSLPGPGRLSRPIPSLIGWMVGVHPALPVLPRELLAMGILPRLRPAEHPAAVFLAERLSALPLLPPVPARVLVRPGVTERATAAMVAQLTSIEHPVLPPQMSFALVEPSGRVLFHSDSRRALTENVLEATDENRLLQSLLVARREGELPLHYWGRRHRAYVRPLPDLPWSLVVSRSVEDVRLRNFELVYDFLNPFLLHLGVLALLIAAFRWIAPRRFRSYLWPSTDNLTAYRRIVWWTLGVSLAFLVLLLADWIHPVFVFLAALLVGPATILFVVWLLPELHRAGQDKPSWLGPAVRGFRGFRNAFGKLRSRFERLREKLSPSEPTAGAIPQQAPEKETSFSALALQRRARRIRLWSLGIAGTSVLGVLLWSGWDAMAVWLVGVTGVISVCLWWFWREFDGARRRIAYTFALSCLLLVSVLPTLGFLELARSRQVQLATQDTTAALARRLEVREKEIHERQGPLPYYDHYRRQLDGTRDDYLSAVYGSRIEEPRESSGTAGEENGFCGLGGTGEGAEPPWSYGSSPRAQKSVPALCRFLRWLERSAVRTLSARPVALNDLTARPEGVDLSRYGSTDGAWEWRAGGDEGGGRVILEPRGQAGQGRPPRLSSTIPVVDTFTEESFLRRLLFVLGLLILGFGPFVLANFIAEKLLLITLVYYGEKPQGKEEGGADGATRGRDRHYPTMRPGESLKDVLEEARKGKGLVRRLVIVAGELDREGWVDKVADLEDVGEAAQQSGDGPPPAGDEESPLPRFHEVRFREAWEEACRPPSALRPPEPVAGDGVSEPAEGGGPEEPVDGQASLEARPHAGSQAGEPGGRPAEDEPGPGASPSQDAEAQAAGRPLSRRQRFEAALLKDSASEEQPVLVTHFEPELEEPTAAADQTAALQNLVERKGRSLVILSDVVPVTTGQTPGTREGEAEEVADAARMRWIELLGSFPVRYARDFNHLKTFSKRTEGFRTRIETLEAGSRDQRVRAQQWHSILGTIEDECEHTPTLRILGHQLLTELFVEIGREEETSTIESAEQELEKLKETLKEAEGKLQDVEDQLRQIPAEASERNHLEQTRVHLQEERDGLLASRDENQEKLQAATKRLKPISKRLEERLESSRYPNLLTDDHVIARVGAGARLHYRYLWSHCNRDEKLVLVQLAQQGLVNPKSFGWVLDLMQRGLVVRSPDLRLMNRSFRNFVLQEFRRSDALEWEEELGPNAWSVLKWILPFPILALAGFLFITQRDAVSNAAGVLVALASLTPVVFNLYGKFQEVNLRRERPEAPAEEG